MVLAPRLQLRQTQSLVMTPQLMQAIKLLQMSNQDLAAYVEAELESNPLLDRTEGDALPELDTPAPAPAADSAAEGGAGAMADLVDTAASGDVAGISREIDADPGDVYEADGAAVQAPNGTASGPDLGSWQSTRGGGQGYDGDGNFLENVGEGEETLRQHIADQLATAGLDPADRLVAGYLVDLIDDAGYLADSVEMVAERLGAEPEKVEAVLEVVQNFDPLGVGARDLAECLSIQLAEQDRLDPAMRGLVDNLDMLAARDLSGLRAICGVDEEDLTDMIAELRALNPKPGHAFGTEPVQSVVPDVFVRAAADASWQVELNSETMPKVLVNESYHAMVSHGARSEEEKSYLGDRLQDANWLVRSLDQRARTILEVSSEIVRQQDMFLTEGVRHLRPLVLKTVADAIEMHESTVSRVTANKYMATPRGVFELKYFFTTAIASTGSGEAHSSEAVRDRIRAMIDAESPDKILSDDVIVTMLREDGIEIARRTVAKYRESLRIPSSVQRRREKRSAI